MKDRFLIKKIQGDKGSSSNLRYSLQITLTFWTPFICLMFNISQHAKEKFIKTVRLVTMQTLVLRELGINYVMKLTYLASFALRAERRTELLAKANENIVNFSPKWFRKPALQSNPCLLRSFGGFAIVVNPSPSQTIRDPMNMNINSYSNILFPADLHAEKGHFRTNSREVTKSFNGARNIIIILFM